MNKWIIEAYAAQDCNIELAVLPSSSPCGSAEADELTKLLLSESAARLFSTGKRIYSGAIVGQSLKSALQNECYLESHKRLSNTLRGLKESAERETAVRIAEWRKRLAALKAP